MAYEISIAELKYIYRRRKKVFLTCFSLIFFACLVAAFTLPSIYESTATIIIENQDIPAEYVRSTTTSYVNERLKIIERKILSYGRLMQIVEQVNPYPDEDSKSEMVSRLYNAVTLRTIDVLVGNRNSSATIAFSLVFEHANPDKAKQVCDILSKMFVEEDQKNRMKRAGNTTLFLEKELDGLRSAVRLHEEKISRFKAKNIDQLPGSTSIFQQTVLRLDQEIRDINMKIRILNEKVVYLKSQIANIDPLVPIVTESGEVASNPNNRLKYLNLQLIQMQSELSDKHPDIIKLKSQIRELESQVGNSGAYKEKANRLKVIEKQIVELKSSYGPKHPDVVKLSKEADLLAQELAQTKTPQDPAGGVDDQSDNPQYMNLRAQIIVAETEIAALREERARLNERLEEYQHRLEMAPFIDEEYNSLTLDYQNAKSKYDEVSNKLHNARIAQELDSSESGERFRIEYPASRPHKPVKPNRKMILLMGFVLGIGCGVTLAAIFEGLDPSVKDIDQLENIANLPVLATISWVESERQKRQQRVKRLKAVITAVVVVVMASFIVNWLVMPIGDIWNKFEDRLIEIGVPIDKKSKKL